MGRAELLIEAARYLNRPELELQARQRASSVVAGMFPAEVRPFIPGFFQGSAGIGYGLLRLIAPDRLPTILLSGNSLALRNTGSGETKTRRTATPIDQESW
jgi:lantibiotic modifying enzyme